MFEYLLRELFILHIAKRFRLPEFFKTFRITFLHAGRKQPSAPPMYAGNPKKQCFPHQDNRKVCVRFILWKEIPIRFSDLWRERRFWTVHKETLRKKNMLCKKQNSQNLQKKIALTMRGFRREV